jgi:hypothetical protein
MKKILVLFLFSLLVIGAFAQGESQVPGFVSEAFTEKYPNFLPLKWSQTQKKAYKAYFNNDGEKAIAYFTPTGRWYRTVVMYVVPPSVVEAYVSKEYDYPDIKKTTLSESPKRNYYSAILDTGDAYHKIYLSESGELLDKKVKPKSR